MTSTSPRRLFSETFSLRVCGGELPGGERVAHEIAVSLAYLPDGRLNDVIFVTRGKSGHGIDLLLSDLGIQLSRAIQGRDPLED